MSEMSMRTATLLSFQRALLGMVPAHLRGVRVEWDGREVRGYFFFAEKITWEEQSLVNDIETEVFADFDPIEVLCRAESLPANQRLQSDEEYIWVYHRLETDFD